MLLFDLHKLVMISKRLRNFGQRPLLQAILPVTRVGIIDNENEIFFDLTIGLQGKAGLMDDLVLHAIASLPPQPHDSIHRALRANPAPPPTLAQQRAAVLY